MMFREMRRSRQQLTAEESAAVLERGTSGVLAVAGDDGYPYAVPLSYVYADGKLYFHCARSGHKLDAVRRHEKASFCVIDRDEILPEAYTTGFRSVIALGRVRELEDETETRAAIERRALRYAPEDDPEGRRAAIDRDYDRMCMLELTVEHMTGKEAIELVRQRDKG